MPTLKFEVIYHYDVWGNEEDGWDVNDSSFGGTIEVEDDGADLKRKIWQTMIDDGIATLSPFEQAEFREMGDGYSIDEAATGRPVFMLNEIND